MPVIRTPDERFDNLPDFPYQPHFVEINGMHIHYIDEGEGEVMSLLFCQRRGGDGASAPEWRTGDDLPSG